MSHISLPFPSLDWRGVERARSHARLGRRVVYEASLPSTNTLARALLRQGADDGTVVVTDDQKLGRGRLGRSWVVPPHSGLTLSVLLHLPHGFQLHTLTPAAALAVRDVVRGVAGARCALKWPNDVLVEGAKVAGILIELDQLEGRWTAVVGIGLNVNDVPSLPAGHETREGALPPTCLAHVAGRPLARESLLIELLDALDNYLDLAARAPADVVRRWRDSLCTLGQRVHVHVSAGVVAGVAVDVDAEGALVVLGDDGARRTVAAGDVVLAP